MIVTIKYGFLATGQIFEALERFTPAALDIEKKLDLPAGNELAVSLSAWMPLKTSQPPYPVAVCLHIVAPCEIVSFEPRSTMATRIAASAERPIIFPKILSQRDITAIVRHLKKQLR